MKKILLFFLMFFCVLQSNAQDDREQIKALKTAFITQELNMSNKIAQKFWPIYEEYENRRRQLHSEEDTKLLDTECINEQQAEKVLGEYLDIERKEYVIKKQLFQDLKEILSTKDIIKLHRLEDEFHKKLIREYRDRKRREEENRKK
ncbi:hypothetical protein [Autumnicola musiva]|uniref:Sensor of ECF-type sigma factor n=1 Tax=Autumnicola musiva TaxID=3075589 RepID=A0ABU3D4F6_9FLAO|nr:hypothetical protein [Zunongwangia sp. F117]MDT0676279.1 hypothetical protein [Zunongwangia sp. F117]